MTDNIPRAEHDRPGWIGHLVVALGFLTLAVVFLVSPTQTGLGRWVIFAAWAFFAAYFLCRSLRLRRDALARDAAWRRWEERRLRLHSSTDQEDAP